MSQTIEVKVPDIGNFKDVAVIEVLVKAGDTVEPEQSLITMETDKATMDIPSPAAGVVKELKLKAGDRISMGSAILTLEVKAQTLPSPPLSGREQTPPSPPLKRVKQAIRAADARTRGGREGLRAIARQSCRCVAARTRHRGATARCA